MSIPPENQDCIAVISDIHGNLTALEAVLADIAANGITRIFNLGDIVGKGPRSAEAIDRSRAVCEVIIQGNWDVDVAAGKPGPTSWHFHQIGPERAAYLAGLPGSFDFTIGAQPARVFHASQIDMFHRAYETSPRQTHRDMFLNTDFTGHGIAPSLVGYGDIHTPFVMSFDGCTLFNAGSVGNPLDLPLACYCVLEGGSVAKTFSPWSIRIVRVPYDIEAEIAVAKTSEMPDFEAYAKELRTAIYRGRQQVTRG